MPRQRVDFITQWRQASEFFKAVRLNRKLARSGRVRIILAIYSDLEPGKRLLAAARAWDVQH